MKERKNIVTELQRVENQISRALSANLTLETAADIEELISELMVLVMVSVNLDVEQKSKYRNVMNLEKPVEHDEDC